MLPIAGRPLIEHLVRWLSAHGIRDVAINLHHRPDVIVGHLGSGISLGARIRYSYEVALLGTAGAARHLEHFFDGPFLVVYGDGYTNLDLGRLIRAHDARRTAGSPHMTMVFQRVPDPSACGVAALDDDGRVYRFAEKLAPAEVFSDLGSAGIIALEREMLELVPAETACDFGHDVVPRALQFGMRVYGEQLGDGEFLIDIGTPSAYDRACRLASSIGDPSSTRSQAVPAGAARLH